MTDMPAAFSDCIASWPAPAQRAFVQLRDVFLQSAASVGVEPLEESLKWGQPAWRPQKPRTGSTARVYWQDSTPDLLSLYVDCKTDLAARMQDLYPDIPVNDGRRHLAVSLDRPLPEQAIHHLAEMTFTYHRAKRDA